MLASELANIIKKLAEKELHGNTPTKTGNTIRAYGIYSKIEIYTGNMSHIDDLDAWHNNLKRNILDIIVADNHLWLKADKNEWVFSGLCPGDMHNSIDSIMTIFKEQINCVTDLLVIQTCSFVNELYQKVIIDYNNINKNLLTIVG